MAGVSNDFKFNVNTVLCYKASDRGRFEYVVFEAFGKYTVGLHINL